MPETKRIIVKITVPEHSGWSMEEVVEEVEAVIMEAIDYSGVLVEIQ